MNHILKNNNMEYSITKTKRNAIILSSVFLILHVIISRLYYLICSPTNIDTIPAMVVSIIWIIPFGYLMLSFYDFFGYYKLKVLQISILTILIMEVIFKARLFTNIFESTWQRSVFFSTHVIWIIVTIILIVLLSMKKMKDYQGALSIRNYAISKFVIFILAGTIPFFVKPANALDAQLLFGLTSVIPFVFTIVFARKVYYKE